MTWCIHMDQQGFQNPKSLLCCMRKACIITINITWCIHMTRQGSAINGDGLVHKEGLHHHHQHHMVHPHGTAEIQTRSWWSAAQGRPTSSPSTSHVASRAISQQQPRQDHANLPFFPAETRHIRSETRSQAGAASGPHQSAVFKREWPGIQEHGMVCFVLGEILSGF